MRRSVIFLILFGFLFLPFKSFSKEKILALVNGEPITQQDFEEALEIFPPQLRSIVENNKDMKRKFLENLIKQKLLIQEMKKEGIKEDDEIKRKVQKYREALLLKKFVDEKLSNIKVSEKEIEDYYNKHKSEFVQPSKVKMRHILVKTKKEALSIREKLIKGADFAELAKKYSIDKASAVKGGELGTLRKDQLVKEFGDVAFSLKPGEISQPVKTKFGYHIIQVEEKTPEVVLPLSHVRQDIEQKLLAEKRAEALNKLVKELEKKSKIEVYLK